jgi:hypothetical protein
LHKRLAVPAAEYRHVARDLSGEAWMGEEDDEPGAREEAAQL